MLTHPIIGLAPMDGVTDAAFRYIVARYGKPDVQFTEFVSVDEICRGTPSAWRQLRFMDLERPVIAQIYGSDPDKFYQAAQVICALGFDGVDINMGCPSKHVSARGCGAALIKTPDLAQRIIRATQAGVHDWTGGHDITQIGLSPGVVTHLQQHRASARLSQEQRGQLCPVSIKTRLGYDTVVVEEWVSTLLETQPDVITLHGRTLAQMYRGQADWDAIRRAAHLVRQTSTLLLGNGDVRGRDEASERVQVSQVHGVLIGRGALGNPWIFRAHRDQSCQQLSQAFSRHGPQDVPVSERLRVALEHARYFATLPDSAPFVAMRKHLGWYCRGFAGAAETRAAMFTTTTVDDVARIFATLSITPA
ncbi:MAG: tRNA dihydrouridine synthase [Candidatus Tectimicrobiota bacterium]